MSIKKIIIMSSLFLSGVVFAEDNGVSFFCESEKLKNVEIKMDDYLNKLNIKNLVVKKKDFKDGLLNYSLKERIDSPVHISKKFNLNPDVVSILDKNGKEVKIEVSSQKEIVLAMLNHGRNLRFKGQFCNFDSLKKNIEIRQNTIAWASNLEWIWPDGDPTFYNKKYWEKNFELKKGTNFGVALRDIFTNQDKYSFGCNFASKLVMLNGVYDYYYRVKKDNKMISLLNQRLLRDGDFLANIDPDYNSNESKENGKVVSVEYGIDHKNIIPGDWVYFENTDVGTKDKLGYEGSNSIYLGQNKFNDYYNDNNHFYTYEEKLDEVYQWRNHVFSRSRDAAKIKHIPKEEFDRLSLSPQNNGMLRTYRVNQYNFAYDGNKLINN